jgi:hypothetical protein
MFFFKVPKFNELKDLLVDYLYVPGSSYQLVRESAYGNLEAVKEIISKQPNVSKLI